LRDEERTNNRRCRREKWGYGECKERQKQESVIKEEETTLSHDNGQNQDQFQSRYAEFERYLEKDKEIEGQHSDAMQTDYDGELKTYGRVASQSQG
jgi:hypothetical protein